MKPVVIGCRTESFSKEQLDVFKLYQPFGMIVFAEPCRKGKETVRHVIGQFESVCSGARIFIDAEGGGVNRLRPEFGHGWREIPPARAFAEAATADLPRAKEAIFLNAQLIAYDLVELGINVNCAPVVDLVCKEMILKAGEDGEPHATSASFFQRSFGNDPAIVAECAHAFIQGLESMGMVGIVKHVPGYGRVSADPHYAQTGIETSRAQLEQTDFVPFRNLKESRAMMTGHVVYKDIDPDKCATISAKVIDVIRDNIGFKGVLVADTIEMNALLPDGFSKTQKDQFGMGLPLPGTLTLVTQAAFAAGCDLVIHSDCSRNFDHTVEVLEAAPHIGAEKWKWMMGKMSVVPTEHAFDRDRAQHKLARLITR